MQSGLRAGSIMPHLHILKSAHDEASLIYSSQHSVSLHDKKIQSLLDIFQPSTSPVTSAQDTPKTQVTPKKLKVSPKSDEDYPAIYDFGCTGDLEPVLVIFDLETTGLRNPRGRIIQIGAKVMNNRPKGNSDESFRTNRINSNNNGIIDSENHEEGTFDCFIKPKNMILTPLITQLTGITQSTLEEKGRNFKIVWSEFLIWLHNISAVESGNRPIVLIAHNGGPFDLPYITDELVRNKLTRIEGDWLEKANIVCLVDTLPLFRNENIWLERKNVLGLSNEYKPKSRKLGDLYGYLFNKPIKNAHSAMGDVLALEAILENEGIRDIWKHYATNSIK